jgi:hypothetical protein
MLHLSRRALQLPGIVAGAVDGLLTRILAAAPLLHGDATGASLWLHCLSIGLCRPHAHNLRNMSGRSPRSCQEKNRTETPACKLKISCTAAQAVWLRCYSVGLSFLNLSSACR